MGESIIAFESINLKAAEKSYPVHYNELLAVKYALVKLKIHLLVFKPFVIYTDHTSLRTATKSPHPYRDWLDDYHSLPYTILK